MSPSEDHNVTHPFVPQLRRDPRALPLRVAAMFKVLVSILFCYFKSCYRWMLCDVLLSAIIVINGRFLFLAFLGIF